MNWWDFAEHKCSDFLLDFQLPIYQITQLPNCPHGFCVGLRITSLTNACVRCVTSISTAWATSSGSSILSGFLPSCGPNSVYVEPGQTTDTRMLLPRSSSATEYVRPFRPHFVA